MIEDLHEIYYIAFREKKKQEMPLKIDYALLGSSLEVCDRGEDSLVTEGGKISIYLVLNTAMSGIGLAV